MAALAIRLVFSLAVVVGLLLLLGRVANRRFQAKAGAVVQVVHRQPLSRGTGVAVVTVGERVLVLGTTEQQVTLLTELEPDELLLAELEPEAAPAPELHTESTHDPAAEDPRPRAVPTTGHGLRAATLTKDPRALARDPLAGSVLSAETWRQALKVARGSARDAS